MPNEERQCPVITWESCYESSWKDIISPMSFQHPAKMSHGLLKRILEHGLAQGYWTAGESILGDPFGGIGSTGIMCSYYGLRSVSVELEPRFYEYATGFECDGQLDDKGKAKCGEEGPHEPHHVLGNFEIHRAAWEKLGLPLPVMVCGDSRNFAAIVGQVAGAVTSPPYVQADAIAPRAEKFYDKWAEIHGRGERFQCHSNVCDTYGSSPGQIGRLRAGSVEAVVTSPPYAEALQAKGGRQRAQMGLGNATAGKDDECRDALGYGHTPGNIGNCRAGSVDSVVTSPPYAEGLGHGGQPTRGDGRTDDTSLDGMQDGYGHTPGNIGNCRAGSVDACITSPPYADAGGTPSLGSVNKDEWGKDGRDIVGRRGLSADYGSTSGQIGRLKAGQVNAVITSPPYAESIKGDHAERETAQESRDARRTPGGSLGQSQRHGGYGASPGNIGNLREGQVEAVVTSPPFMDNNVNIGAVGGTPGMRQQIHNSKPRKESYGASDGQIGNSTSESYWSAMRTVYEQMHLAMKPGGVLCVVLKDYIKGGKRVPLVDDTLKLLVHLGFQPIERVHAMLTKESRQADLFGRTITKNKERKSFFRRLFEKRAAAKKYWETLSYTRQQAAIATARADLEECYRVAKAEWDALPDDDRDTEPVPPTEAKILSDAKMLAYFEDGEPQMAMDVRIDWEEVLIVRKP